MGVESNPAGFVAAGVAVAAGCASVGGLAPTTSVAIGAGVVGTCFAVSNFLTVEPQSDTKSKKGKKKGKKGGAAPASRDIDFGEFEDETPAAGPSKSALKKARKRAAAKEKKDKEAAVKKAETAAKKKAKKQAKKEAAKKAAEPEPEPVVVETKKKKKKKKKGKKAAEVVVVPEPEPESEDEGWEEVQVVKSSKQKRSERADESGDGKPEKKKPGHTQLVEISPRLFGKIIGPQGSTRQALADASGCDIQVPKRDAAQLHIIVTGDTAAACKVCATAIEELAKKGYCSLLNADTSDEGINIPLNKHGVVIGQRGSNLKAIQEKTGCRVNMPDRDSGSERITVVGPASDTRTAIEAIRQLAKDGFSSLTHPDYVKDSVSIQGSDVSTVIGSGGATIKALQSNTGAKINIPNGARGNIVVVELVGSIGDVAAARTQILALVKPPEPIPIPEEWSQSATAAMLNLW